MEEPTPKNRHAVEPFGVTAASWPTAREEEIRQRRRREVVDSSEQKASPATADADLASAIRQLPSHLQSMVTLLAKMVSPSV